MNTVHITAIRGRRKGRRFGNHYVNHNESVAAKRASRLDRKAEPIDVALATNAHLAAARVESALSALRRQSPSASV